MKIGKFIGKETVPLNSNEIMFCIAKLQGTKLKHSGDSVYIGRMYEENLGEIPLNGKHKYWGTDYKIKTFKAVAKKINLYIHNQKGRIEGVDNSDNSTQYSASLKLYGDFRYKYQRGWNLDEEVYSYYDYDTNLGDLLGRIREYYNNVLK